MAHFARIEQVQNTDTGQLEWIVREVIVASNDISTAAGPLGDNDMHADAETYVANMFKHLYPNGGVWKQTSYNQNFRHRFAGPGDIYLETADKFISTQPYPSWHLSNETFDWTAPTPYPSIVTYTDPEEGEYIIHWDEDLQKWQAMASHLTVNAPSHEWNPDTEAWVEL